MIDLHCHLLPGIDDGAKTVADSIELLRIAVGDGITKMVMTPHIEPGRYNNNLQTISESFNQFTNNLKEINIRIEIAMAAEVRLDPLVLPMIEDGQIPFLGEENGYKIMLLELPHWQIPAGTENFINYLIKNSIRPIIAHPERNRVIMDDMDKLKKLQDIGCLTQITSSSVTGNFGKNIQRSAINMLNQGCVDIIASDAHDAQNRPPTLSTARALTEALVGKEKTWELVYDRPKSISDSKFH